MVQHQDYLHHYQIHEFEMYFELQIVFDLFPLDYRFLGVQLLDAIGIEVFFRLV